MELELLRTKNYVVLTTFIIATVVRTRNEESGAIWNANLNAHRKMHFSQFSPFQLIAEKTQFLKIWQQSELRRIPDTRVSGGPFFRILEARVSEPDTRVSRISIREFNFNLRIHVADTRLIKNRPSKYFGQFFGILE